MSVDIDPFDPERFRLKSAPVTDSPEPNVIDFAAVKSARPQFARTWLACLTDRTWDELFPARTRLWLFLLIKSREGRRPVRLSNELAGEIGLDRKAKWRALDHLERDGLVFVTRSGKATPVVSLAVDPESFKDPRCRQKRDRVSPKTGQGVAENAHQVGESISTYLSTLISNNDSYREADPPPARWALFDLPSQPLDPRLPIPEPTRDAVYDRADRACEQCRRELPLELHHLHYNTQGEEEPEDLQALCRECHDARHHDVHGKFWIDPVELRQFWGTNPPPAEMRS